VKLAKFFNGSLKRGDLLDCKFGMYTPMDLTKPEGPFVKDNYNIKIPNEIWKTRPVVVIAMTNGQVTVVPVSTAKHNHQKPHRTLEAQGIHVKLSSECFPPNCQKYDTNKDCWAKADLVQTVDEKRLRDLYLTDGSLGKGRVPQEILDAIRYGVMKSIGLTPLVPPTLAASIECTKNETSELSGLNEEKSVDTQD
jgi:uncharacterized protein YifN (PemK superfamily)